MSNIRIIHFIVILLLSCSVKVATSNPIEVDVPIEFQPGIKGAVELTFDSEIDVYYQLEISDDLVDWENEGYSVKGTGGQLTILASTRGFSTLFYRLSDDGDPLNIAPIRPVAIWRGGPSSTSSVGNTFVTIPLNLAEVNTISSHLTVGSNGTVTVLQAGWYSLNVKVLQRTSATGEIRMFKNGSIREVTYNQVSNTQFLTNRILRTEYFEKDDQFYFDARVNGGSGLEAFRSFSSPFFTVIELRYLQP